MKKEIPQVNAPYVKAHIDGKLINPITKEKPYRSLYPNRAKRRLFLKFIVKGSKLNMNLIR